MVALSYLGFGSCVSDICFVQKRKSSTKRDCTGTGLVQPGQVKAKRRRAPLLLLGGAGSRLGRAERGGTPSETGKDCTEFAATWEASELSGIKPGSLLNWFPVWPSHLAFFLCLKC